MSARMGYLATRSALRSHHGGEASPEMDVVCFIAVLIVIVFALKSIRDK